MSPLPSTSPEPEAFSFNPFRIGYCDDPYPAYHQLRAERPVYWVPGCLGKDWILSRYDDVYRLLRDPRCGADDLPQRIRAQAADAGCAASVAALCDVLDGWLFFADGAAHQRLHRLVARRFTPAAVQRLGRAVERIVDRLLDDLPVRDGFDLMARFARLVPLLVSAHLLGTSVHRAETLADLARDVFSVFEQPASLTRYQHLDGRTRALRDFARRVLDDKRVAPADDLGSDLAAAIAGGEATAAEALGLCLMILAVGQDTTHHLIGNAVYALLQHPEQLALLQSEPSLATAAVKELARFNTPVQLVVHVAREPIELDAEVAHPGERLHFCLGAAHRDPAAFASPDRLDLRRERASRLLFGAGPHYCLGAHLALLQAEVALPRLFDRFPQLRLLDPPPRWIKSVHMRGLARLPLAPR